MKYHKYTPEEVDFIYQHYSSMGPKKVGEHLGLSMRTISKKARRLGLYRGQVVANKERKISWNFTQWSYDLGYIVGVYLGDGHVRRVPNQTAYFRLSVKDRDFCVAVENKIWKEIGVEGNIAEVKCGLQHCLTVCNTDFCDWLITNFGPANQKRIRLLPDIEANKGMLEGLIDSEGTVGDYSIQLRMDGDLGVIQKICKQLGVQPGPQHKGVRQEKWQSSTFQGYSIGIREYNRVGLGTYLMRKSKKGIRYKGYGEYVSCVGASFKHFLPKNVITYTPMEGKLRPTHYGSRRVEPRMKIDVRGVHYFQQMIVADLTPTHNMCSKIENIIESSDNTQEVMEQITNLVGIHS